MSHGPEFLAPLSLDDAVSHCGDEQTVIIGGGTVMALMLRERLVEPERLLWLGRVEELTGVVATSDGLQIGATTTLWDVARSPEVMRDHPMVAAAARSVGNPRIRAVATVGGAVAHADPRQDLLPALLASGAIVRLVGPAGRRDVVMADGFFRGFLETARGDDELLEAVLLPDPTPGVEHYVRYTPVSDGDYPTVSVAARLVPDGPGLARVTVALGGVGSVPILGWTPLDGPVDTPSGSLDEVLARVGERITPFDDARGSADYKLAMATMWTRRVIEHLAREAA